MKQEHVLQYYEAKVSAIAAASAPRAPPARPAGSSRRLDSTLDPTRPSAAPLRRRPHPPTPPGRSHPSLPALSTLCWKPEQHLVPKFVNVVEEPVEGKGCLVGVRAAVAAPAGLDHHDVLGKRLPVLAAEAHLHGPRLLRRAAAAVHAGAAVLGPVLLHAGAAGVSELDRLGGFPGLAASLALFQAAEGRLSTRPHLADAGFLHQAAVGVVIGDAGGDASSAGL